MRVRHIATWSAGAALLALLWLLRHHLRDLSEVARTYMDFYPYLHKHPQTRYRYQPPQGENQSLQSQENSRQRTPTILHSIYLTEGRDPASADAFSSTVGVCRSMHPNWTHNFWNDSTADSFIAKEYPDIHPHYVGYRQGIQRANILRYALLHHFGGVYLDVDVTCLQPLDNLLELPWLTPAAHPAGVNNAFMLARPGHPMLRQMLSQVPNRDLTWGMPYVENMLSTGCMFFSNRWMSYARSLARNEPKQEEDRVYVLADEHGKLAPHMLRGAVTTPLFRHEGASSWHGWDASLLLFIGQFYGYLALGVVLLVAVGTALLCWRVLRGRCGFGKRKRSWFSVERESGSQHVYSSSDEESTMGPMMESSRRMSAAYSSPRRSDASDDYSHKR